MNSRRDLIVFSAIFISVLAHVGVMYFVRTQTLAEIARVDRLAAPKRPTAPREARHIPEAIRLDAVPDVQPLRESPEASSEALLPTSAALAEDDAGFTPPLPADSNRVVAEQPVLEVAPKFSEKILAKDVSSFVTPIADTEPFGLTTPAPRTAPDVPVRVNPADAMVAPPPVFNPPPAERPPEPDVASIPSFEPESVPEMGFKPLDEVMKELDENVIEAEKAAVRGLLDVKDAKELKECVRIETKSASQGDWTFFRIMIDPTAELPVVPKDMVILMDASGSIANDRLRSCRAAAKEILRTCTNTRDRFNLVAFRDEFDYAFNSWQECNAESFERADKWLGKLVAHGRTDVFATIRSVLKLPRDPKRPIVAMVVTDGDANAGVSRTADILSKFTELNDGLVSVYMYGVKSTANRELIDVLTHGNRGESIIFEGYRKEAGSGIEKLSDRFRDPVLSDIRIVYTADSNAESYPRMIKNLYRGDTVEIVGRVPKRTRTVSFSLKGLNGPRAYEGFFSLTLSAAEFDPALPGDWAKERDIDLKLR